MILRPISDEELDDARGAARPEGVERRPFDDALWPVVAVARARLYRARPAIADRFSARARTHLEERLLERLTGVSLRAFLAELDAARRTPLPEDAGRDARHGALVGGWVDGGYRTLFEKYPALAALWAASLEGWVEASAELLDRLDADAEALSVELGARGRVVGLGPERSDAHAHGRSVVSLLFESGARVIYKPRSLDAEAALDALASWCWEKGASLRLAHVLSVRRATHGWQELVEPRPCASGEEVARFYRRAGMLLALLHALRATDVHAENLVARGEDPLVVDAETLLHPERPNQASTLPERFARSVARTNMLPAWMHDPVTGHVWEAGGVGEPSNGRSTEPHPRWEALNEDAMRLVMGEAPKTWPHLPSLDGRPVGPAAHLASFAEGFEETHELFSKHAEELTSAGGLLTRFLGLRTRVIARPTNLYKALLRESVQPVHLTDEAGRSRCFEGLEPEEIESLERFDVPLFTNVAGESELASARAALGGSSEDERAWQVSVLRGAVLANAARPIVGTRELPLGAPISRARLLEEAEAIRCRLDEAAHREPDGSLGWMGFQSLPGAERFRFGPLGGDLADGRGGVALFLAALDLARGIVGRPEALERAAVPLRRVLATAAHAPRRPRLFDDPAALEAVLAAPLPAGDSLCCGFAGRLDLELEAVRILGRPLDRVYVLAASWLARAGTRGGYELLSNVPPSFFLPGLLHGWSGIGFVLARLAAPERVPSLLGPAE